MNREIKFRAIDRKTTKVVFEGTLSDVRNAAGRFNFTTWEWLEYTGLTDKNGKEIYEGDIVSSRLGIYKFVIPSEMKLLHTGGESNMSCYGWDFHGYDASQLEVTWNIYENADLLKTD